MERNTPFFMWMWRPSMRLSTTGMPRRGPRRPPPRPPPDPTARAKPAPETLPPSEYSREPSLAAPIMLHVAVALPLADAGEPQVELLDVLVLADRPGVAVEDDAPVLHHVAVLSEPERHRGVLLGEQDGDARLTVHAADDLEDLVHQHRRQAHRGLVEEHEPGPGHERAADRHHLLLAA